MWLETCNGWSVDLSHTSPPPLDRELSIILEIWQLSSASFRSAASAFEVCKAHKIRPPSWASSCARKLIEIFLAINDLFSVVCCKQSRANFLFQQCIKCDGLNFETCEVEQNQHACCWESRYTNYSDLLTIWTCSSKSFFGSAATQASKYNWYKCRWR